MKAAGRGLSVALAGALSLAGCYVPKSQLVNEQTTNRVLAEQNRAYLVQIDNLKAHSTQVENRLIRAEQELAARDRTDNGRRDAPVGGGSESRPDGAY